MVDDECTGMLSKAGCKLSLTMDIYFVMEQILMGDIIFTVS